MKVAAVQLEPRIADVAENLARSELLADDAGARGAELIVLPEFFTTGMAFREELADAALLPTARRRT
ncbi:MAG: nitrilase-related carbon-nitrogen hydrolase [Thermoleophilaceae bacterium]